MPTMEVFVIGRPLATQEVVKVLQRCFPKMPKKASRDAFKKAVGFLGKDRFEHEVNRDRGWAFDMVRGPDGVYRTE